VVAGTYYLAHHQEEVSARDRVMGEVVLTLESGTTLDTESLEGKPTVVMSWATWCPECLGILTVLSRVENHFADSVTTIAVNRKEDEQIVRDYRTHYALPDNIIYTKDVADAYYQQSGGHSMPEVVVYDQKGALIAHFLALPTEAELIDIISPLVKP
jgi:thiol-disulfide isomerase/thioredoxin